LAKNALSKVLYGREHCNDENPVVAVRSLMFFNECRIIHAPLLTAGLIVLEKYVYNG